MLIAIILEPETDFVVTKVETSKDKRSKIKIFLEVLKTSFVGKQEMSTTAEHYAPRYGVSEDSICADSENLLNKLSGISKNFYVNATESLKNAFPEIFDVVQKELRPDKLLNNTKAMNGIGLSREDVLTLYALCFDIGNNERSTLDKLNAILRENNESELYDKAEFILNALGSLRKLPRYKPTEALYIALNKSYKKQLEKSKTFYLPEIALSFEASELARKMFRDSEEPLIIAVRGNIPCYDVQMFTQTKKTNVKLPIL